ncbi:hypothetical protein SCLCIDRAFT_184498 [Scleroderma citrinum Foug A]|uniref:DUF6533 domain-containing protein n=1 Tax=Scleroderma citrinum Foug A TaxID=1036808 RepID=A0A0C2ZXK0_9AGAM|nr:hypothetical protein SCLCIDRAFT_184498 [Scleroderma citrinum Foug A]
MSSQLDIDRLFTAVVFTLVLYDYTLTIGQEIELFWKRSRRSWTFFLFIANRYITLFGRVPLLVYSFWPSESYSDPSVILYLSLPRWRLWSSRSLDQPANFDISCDAFAWWRSCWFSKSGRCSLIITPHQLRRCLCFRRKA